MAVNFYPNREQMLKEIETCIQAGKLEVLTSFCTSCVYDIFQESDLVPECSHCRVHQGIRGITGRTRLTDTIDHEFLGVC